MEAVVVRSNMGIEDFERKLNKVLITCSYSNVEVQYRTAPLGEVIVHSALVIIKDTR